jgi:hypothetical protein
MSTFPTDYQLHTYVDAVEYRILPLQNLQTEVAVSDVTYHWVLESFVVDRWRNPKYKILKVRLILRENSPQPWDMERQLSTFLEADQTLLTLLGIF